MENQVIHNTPQNQFQGLDNLCRTAFESPEVDITAVKCVVGACIERIKDHGVGKLHMPELSLAATKLQEAVFWIDEYQRLS